MQQLAVFFDVIFTNIGNRRITASPRLTEEEIEDYEQSVVYPADLQVRRLGDDFAGPKFAGWWSKSNPLRS